MHPFMLRFNTIILAKCKLIFLMMTAAHSTVDKQTGLAQGIYLSTTQLFEVLVFSFVTMSRNIDDFSESSIRKPVRDIRDAT